MMLLTGRESIRDVIAFPKAASGHDPLTGAPTAITPQQRKEAGIDAIPAERPEGTGGQPPGGTGWEAHGAAGEQASGGPGEQ